MMLVRLLLLLLTTADVRHTGTLLVSLRDAKDLATLKDDGSVPDVMCTIDVDGKTEGRSTVKTGEKSPLWAEEFLIEK